ncbi:ichor-like [Anthonomus grandis grandis]|uniref:ichor-like n=1 Tax=Anthonomus grandis grandis TaxID=2921223 RepID=UPI002166982B|nr:ichor-like [Anthonomus grandis grandis]
MKTMKYPNLSGSNMAVSGSSAVDEVDSIFTSPCWQNSSSSEFIDHKLILDGAISNLGSDKLLLEASVQDDSDMENKASMDVLNNLLSSSQTMSLAELKPLPPFTNYTANLSINGIQGHHYHTISQRIPEENNNNYSNFSEQNIVSSSTCNIGSDSGDEKTLYTVDEVAKLGYDCADSVSSAIKFEDCASIDSAAQIKSEITEYDISSIDDIAAIIGSAIADTTVPSTNPESDDPNASRDSWMDLDAWIDQNYGDQKEALIINDSMSEFLVPSTSSEFSQKSQSNIYGGNGKPQAHQSGSTLQSLLTHGSMPLLQYRLQNGPPVKQEAPSSTNYAAELIPTASPPANVVSTTDNLLLTVNGRFIPQYSIHSLHEDHRIRSPELMGQNYPHTTTTTTTSSSTKKRNRNPKKQQSASTAVFSTDQTLGLLGKEKPVHRCNICNRGFLNKSNIKVHLRTHTGEKPFRCDTCAKAFRQKAHLLKHQQIHKRIGRD